MKALAKSGAEVIALTRTQADLDSLKPFEDQCHKYVTRVINLRRPMSQIRDTRN